MFAIISCRGSSKYSVSCMHKGTEEEEEDEDEDEDGDEDEDEVKILVVVFPRPPFALLHISM